MKKTKLFVLSAMAALVLAACGMGGNGSAPSSNDLSSFLPDSSVAGGSDNGPEGGADASSESKNTAGDQSSESKSAASSADPSKSSSSSKSSSAMPIGNSNSEGPATDWASAEKTILKNYFYNADIPAPVVNGRSKLAYDADDGVAYTFGGTATPELLKSYADKFNNSWEDNSTAGTSYASSYGYYYAFEKGFETDAGMRYVSVLFAGLDDEYYVSEDGNGLFYLEISDPYEYAWPEATVAEAVSTYMKSTEVVPAFAADRYSVRTSYLESYSTLVMYAYTNNADAETTYANALVAAGWTYDGALSSGGAQYSSPNETLSVQFKYDDSYKDLDIYIMPYDGGSSGGDTGDNTTDAWPSDLVAEYLADYLNTEETVPAFTAGTSYEIHSDYMSEGYLWMYIQTTAEAFADYEDALYDAGYTYSKTDSYGDDIWLSAKGEIEIDVGFDTSTNELDLWIIEGSDSGDEPSGGDYEAWPAEEVAAAIAAVCGSDEEIPAFNYALQLVVDDETMADDEMVNIYAFTDADYTDYYGTKLMSAGFDYLGANDEGFYYFTSPEETLTAAFACYEYELYEGYYVWDLYVFPNDGAGDDDDDEPTEAGDSWSDAAKEILNTYFYGIDLPYLAAGGTDKLTYVASSNFAYCLGATCDAELLAQYAALFDDSWEADHTAGTAYAEDYGYYYCFTKAVSTPSGTRYVEVLIGGYSNGITSDGSGKFFIQVSDPYNYDWPEEAVASCLEAMDATDNVPVCPANYYQTSEKYISYGILAIVAYTNNANIQSDYAAILLAAGYVYAGEDSYGYDCYTAPSELFQVQIAYNEESGALYIYVYNVEYL